MQKSIQAISSHTDIQTICHRDLESEAIIFFFFFFFKQLSFVNNWPLNKDKLKARQRRVSISEYNDWKLNIGYHWFWVKWWWFNLILLTPIVLMIHWLIFYNFVILIHFLKVLGFRNKVCSSINNRFSKLTNFIELNVSIQLAIPTRPYLEGRVPLLHKLQ